jgi:hypothetical protein
LDTADRRERRWGTVLASLLAIVASAWWLRPAPPPPDLPDRAASANREAPAAAAPRAAPPPPSARAPVATASFTPAGVRIMPADAARGEPGMAPHPSTPQHARIYRENALIANLNGAMDVRDAAGMRELLEQYREEYPEDEHEMQRGYELIAACFERPGPESRADAQRYYDEQLASGLRRYIRRYCLE